MLTNGGKKQNWSLDWCLPDAVRCEVWLVELRAGAGGNSETMVEGKKEHWDTVYFKPYH